MTFWTILVVLCLLAIVFAIWPLWRESRRLTPLVATLIVFTVALSVGLYDHIGSPGISPGNAAPDEVNRSMDDVLASLEARLANNPDDIEGWRMLARSHMSLQNPAGAANALEIIMELEQGQNAQTLIDLAVAIANRDQTGLEGRAASLVENALVLDPNNQPALFYLGLGAANRGDTDTAATYWEKLLGLNPTDDVRGIIERNLAAWRGEPMPAAATPVEAATPDAPVPDDAVVSARVSLSDEAMAAMTGDANIFVIARDPAVPTPPIAVSRIRVSELPATVSLSDSQSMVEGRNLSGFPEIELLARVSMSGGPAAQSGDWFGSLIVRPAANNSVTLTIDRQVP